jgi:hypothetical protein
VERGQGAAVVVAELGDLGVADAFEEGDRVGELALVLVCQAETVEHVQGLGVIGAKRAFESLGGRLGHLQDLGVSSTAVVKNVRENALSLIGFG